MGLIPGGAGNMNMLWRALEGIPEGTDVDTLPFVSRTFQNIAMAKVATSAEEAKEFGYFRKTDGISFDKARLLTEAKARAIGLAEAGYHPPRPRDVPAAGRERHRHARDDGRHARRGRLRERARRDDRAQARRGALRRPSGGAHEVTEEEMLELEREAFVSLCGEPKSQERMQHMLMNNKPLRN